MKLSMRQHIKVCACGSGPLYFFFWVVFVFRFALAFT